MTGVRYGGNVGDARRRRRPSHHLPGYRVRGRVLDLDDAPVRGVPVAWVDPGHAGGERVDRLRIHIVAYSNARGEFRTRELPPGPCILCAPILGSTSGRASIRLEHGVPLVLPAGEVVLRSPLTPSRVSEVRGQILTWEGHRPLPGHPMRLLDAATGGEVYREVAMAGGDGRFILLVTTPGTYRFVALGTMERRPSSSVLELRRGRSLRVEARLTAWGGDHPLRDLPVRCSDETGAPVAGAKVSSEGLDFESRPFITGEDGRTVLESVPVDPTAVFAFSDGHAPGHAAIDAAREPTELPLVLDRMVPLGITVLDAATGDPLSCWNVVVMCGGYGFLGGPGDGPGGERWGPGIAFVRVLLGTVEIRVAAPGFEDGEARIEVPAGGMRDLVRLELRARDSS